MVVGIISVLQIRASKLKMVVTCLRSLLYNRAQKGSVESHEQGLGFTGLSYKLTSVREEHIPRDLQPFT